MSNKDNNNQKIDLKEVQDIFEKYSKIVSALEVINKSNKQSIVKDYEFKLNRLLKKERRTLADLRKNITENKLLRIEKDIQEYLNDINLLESSLTGSKEKELNDLLLEVNQLYRETQSKYITLKFDNVNQKLDDKITETENSTSTIMFNVISIFLGISITSAMITGFNNIDPIFTIFYFMSCAWIALTILTISSIYLKRLDKKTYIILGLYIIYSIIWINIGLLSYNLYDEKIKNESINTKEVSESKDNENKKENYIIEDHNQEVEETN